MADQSVSNTELLSFEATNIYIHKNPKQKEYQSSSQSLNESEASVIRKKTDVSLIHHFIQQKKFRRIQRGHDSANKFLKKLLTQQIFKCFLIRFYMDYDDKSLYIMRFQRNLRIRRKKRCFFGQIIVSDELNYFQGNQALRLAVQKGIF